MDYTNDFEIKRTKYMPIFPKATGQPTIYLEGYPFEDDEPMAATLYHAKQIPIFYEQLERYYWTDPHILIGIDSFIHPPNLEEPAEFRGWYRDTSGEIVEMTQDTPRTLYSERLKLLFTWNIDMDLDVRLLRPYLLDGTPITTSIEEHTLRKTAEAKVEEQAEKIREQAAELERLRQQLVDK